MKNVKLLTDEHCRKVESVFNAAIGQRDATTRWKKPEVHPNSDAIFKICELFNCSSDWLLSGTEPLPVRIPAIGEKPTEYQADKQPHPCAGVEEHCPKFKNILLSDHKVIKDAFLANLHAFDYSISKEKEQDGKIKEQDGKIDNMGAELGRALKEIRQLREAMQAGRSTDTDAVASSNIGKRET